MNIARVQRMAVEGDLSVDALRYFLDCHGECEHLDFKSTIDLKIEHDAVCIAKDLVGMKNIGGGFIVIGVVDKTWEPIGISKSLGYDTKMMRDLVRKYTGLEIELYVVEHTIYSGGCNRIYCIIGVRAASKFSKLKTPSSCKKSVQEGEKWGIRKGDIYIRQGDQTVRLEDLALLQEKLEDLQDKYQEADQIEAT